MRKHPIILTLSLIAGIAAAVAGVLVPLTAGRSKTVDAAHARQLISTELAECAVTTADPASEWSRISGRFYLPHDDRRPAPPEQVIDASCDGMTVRVLIFSDRVKLAGLADNARGSVDQLDVVDSTGSGKLRRGVYLGTSSGTHRLADGTVVPFRAATGHVDVAWISATGTTPDETLRATVQRVVDALVIPI